ncbi:MAG: TrmB family transcriptional regulator [Nitrososphaerales archaeon]
MSEHNTSGTISAVYELEDNDVKNENPSVHKMQEELTKFGLTPNESKVYMYLAQHGYKRAIEVARSTRIPRTEMYHLLSSLQNKGLVTATFGHPIKFNAVQFDNALKIMIDMQKERVRVFERREKDLIHLWKSIPEFATDDTEEREKFQILEGPVQVYSKAADMRQRAKSEVLTIGYEKDYLRLYHHDFLDNLDSLSKSGVTIKLLGSFSSHSQEIFDGIDADSIREIPKNVKAPLCFVMIDRSELLFFLKKGETGNKDILAMWTDCSPFIEAMHILFSEIWKKSAPMVIEKSQ